MVSALGNQLGTGDRVVVYTTMPKQGDELFDITDRKVKIVRTGKFSLGLSFYERYSTYLMFYLKSFLGTLIFRPGKLFYYETISSLTPIFYKRLIGDRAELYIHYHEYMTPKEYNATFLNRTLLNLEKIIYRKASWISHTNEDRLKLFCDDMGYTGTNNIFVLPNYPPATWNVPEKTPRVGGLLKLVYVGSFGSLETIYIKEIIEWVSKNAERVCLDVYSNNITDQVREWIDLQPRKGLNIRGNVPYKKLPDILPSYDIGLILYKGANANFIYNAPNKLFEYQGCGLEVWYPKEMLGIDRYACQSLHPAVIRCDFSALDDSLITQYGSRAAFPKREISYKFEEIAAPLLRKLSN
jgi:hypothetical protein